ncbi:antifreeze protein [Antarctobacter jejuensis]|uniref:antifreeze protein n=1 Tax=Antarctobacter jejuensis TaxID=1439938 RepID=UPI003FD0507A
MARFSPFDLWINMAHLAWMTAEAQAVISMRLMGMAGFWSVSPRENSLMVSEKSAAFAKAMNAASMAAMNGGDPMAAAIAPLRRKTRSNVVRLAKRGPKRRP